MCSRLQCPIFRSLSAKALDAGLDSCIIDPASPSMMGILYAHAAVSGEDKGGRKYNRAFRKKIIR